MNLKDQWSEITSKFAKHAAELQDGAAFAYVKKQLEYIESQGGDPTEYEVFLVSDQFPMQLGTEKVEVKWRLKLVHKSELNPNASRNDDELTKRISEVWFEHFGNTSPAGNLMFSNQVRHALKNSGYMTGNDWFEVFKKEYLSLIMPGQMNEDDLTKEEILEAARKAAGIK